MQYVGALATLGATSLPISHAGKGIEAARLDGAQPGRAQESRSREAENSMATAAGNDYDLEVDCTEPPYGKLDILIQLPGSAEGGSREE